MGSVLKQMAFRNLLLFACLALVWAGCKKKTAEAPPPPPPEVLVMEVQPKEVPIFREYVGTLEGYVNADIQARVSGYLTAQKYQDGKAVKKNDPLFEIDPRPFEATLARAKASLAEAEASQKQADLNAEKVVELFSRKVVSTQERDNAVQNARALLASTEAQRAAVKQAQLDLDFTRINAPIDGVVGVARAQVGDLVGPSTGTLTSMSTVDPIKVYFTVSEQRYTAYVAQYGTAEKRTEHEKKLEFELLLANGSVYPERGEFFASDREVDARTGSLRIAALFKNPGNALRPGQFARVRVQTEVLPQAMLVPQRAVTELQGIYQVFVVDAQSVAGVRPLKLKERIGSDWLVESGLKPRDRLVVEGVQKVRDGTKVAAKPWTPPAPAPALP